MDLDKTTPKKILSIRKMLILPQKEGGQVLRATVRGLTAQGHPTPLEAVGADQSR